MPEDIKNPPPPPPPAADEKGAKAPKLLKFRAREPMAEMVRGEMFRVAKGEIIELSAARAKAISFLVDPAE